MSHEPRTVYFAGGLFNHKDLVGNWLLADAIECVSQHNYAVRLPQFLTNTCVHTPGETRDADFALMLSCDCIVANFDGPDLDSGTVIEFCFAKMMDYPAVLLRSDFRKNGDQDTSGDPWNLMCSGYPRTKSVWFDGMADLLKIYNREKAGAPAPQCQSQCLLEYEQSIALRIVAALDEVCAMPPVFEKDELLHVYRNAVKSTGGSLPQKMPIDTLQRILSAKSAHGIYS